MNFSMLWLLVVVYRFVEIVHGPAVRIWGSVNDSGFISVVYARTVYENFSENFSFFVVEISVTFSIRFN